jgi:glutathione peroxidase
MKKSIIIICKLALFSCKNQAQQASATTINTVDLNKSISQKMEKENIYQFKVLDLSGKEFDFATLKGKKILIVNTASKCGYTSQYKGLEEIYEKYKSENFVIVGFPANNFGSQEPGTDKEIESFCQLNYGVTFPMMSKKSVKGGNMDKVYQFLTQKAKNGLQDSEVQWNFQKYLIGANGELEKVLLSKVKPTDSEIVDWITKK